MNNRAAAEWKTFGFLPILAALGYATAVIHVYSMGPYIEPLQAEFGWSRAQISSGLTVAATLSGLFCIPIGILIDRIGPRRVALVGLVMITAGYALLGTATGQMSNWMALWVLIAVGTLGVQTTVWTSAVASRFEASRGLALAVTLSGASIAATVFPVLASWLIGRFDWRTAFIIQGASWGLLVFPIMFIGFRGARDRARKAGADGVVAEAGARALTGVTFGQGLRMPALYKLLLVGALVSFTVVGALVHFVPILTDGGSDRLQAAGIASLIGLASIVGRLGTGVLLDRFQGHRIGAAACLLPIAASALLLLDGTNPLNQSAAAIMLGLALGAEVDVVAYLASRHFGLRSFGALYGALVMALALGTAFGPLAAGAMYDHFGNYSQFLVLIAGLMLLAAIALASLGPAPEAAPGDAHGG